ncbi:MAG: hypothetical protein Q9171_003122 [Xanthocarpia ochracea]
MPRKSLARLEYLKLLMSTSDCRPNIAPLPAESDAESIASDVPMKPELVQVQTQQEGADTPEVMEEDGQEDEEEDGEELFIVEEILKHHDNFEDGEMRYEIKWKGYPKKADRTWETEGNLEGARDLLEAYWKRTGGKPVPTPKEPKPAGRKRGRQSTGTINAPKKQKRGGRKSASAAQEDDDDATPEPPAGYTDVNPDTWKPPPPLDNAWEDLVMNVDTIEKDDNGELWAYLVWNQKNEDNRFNRSKARVPTCNKACPQRMLQFYEKHVYVSFPRPYLSAPAQAFIDLANRFCLY